VQGAGPRTAAPGPGGAGTSADRSRRRDRVRGRRDRDRVRAAGGARERLPGLRGRGTTVARSTPRPGVPRSWEGAPARGPRGPAARLRPRRWTARPPATPSTRRLGRPTSRPPARPHPAAARRDRRPADLRRGHGGWVGPGLRDLRIGHDGQVPGPPPAAGDRPVPARADGDRPICAVLIGVGDGSARRLRRVSRAVAIRVGDRPPGRVRRTGCAVPVLVEKRSPGRVPCPGRTVRIRVGDGPPGGVRPASSSGALTGRTAPGRPATVPDRRQPGLGTGTIDRGRLDRFVDLGRGLGSHLRRALVTTVIDERRAGRAQPAGRHQVGDGHDATGRGGLRRPAPGRGQPTQPPGDPARRNRQRRVACVVRGGCTADTLCHADGW
jgi:hypothetical protein